ncbi:MAG: hypothetical protein ACNS60_18875 [Candidatus Cyclobacteriaceae bacterium M2_1C_046]
MILAESNLYHIFSPDANGEITSGSSYNTFDLGLALNYIIAKSETCGNLIIGTGLYKTHEIDQLEWYITPRLSYDIGNYSFEILSDMSVPNLVESLTQKTTFYSTFEMGLFWKL